MFSGKVQKIFLVRSENSQVRYSDFQFISDKMYQGLQWVLAARQNYNNLIQLQELLEPDLKTECSWSRTLKTFNEVQ